MWLGGNELLTHRFRLFVFLASNTGTMSYPENEGKRYAYISYWGGAKQPSFIERSNDLHKLQDRFFESGCYSGTVWDYKNKRPAKGTRRNGLFGNNYTNRELIYEATAGAAQALSSFANGEVAQDVAFSVLNMANSSGKHVNLKGRYAYLSYGSTNNTPTVFKTSDSFKEIENRFHGGGNYSAIVFDTKTKSICTGKQNRGNRGAGPGGTYKDQPLIYDTGLKFSIDTMNQYVASAVAVGLAAAATGGAGLVVAGVASASIGAASAVGDMTAEACNNSNVGRLVRLAKDTWGLADHDPNLWYEYTDAIGRYAYLSYSMTSNTPTLFACYRSLGEAEERFHSGGNYSAVIYDIEKHAVAKGVQDRGIRGKNSGSYKGVPLMYDTGIDLVFDDVKMVLDLGIACYKLSDPGKFYENPDKLATAAAELLGDKLTASELTALHNVYKHASSSARLLIDDPALRKTNVGRLLAVCLKKRW